MVTPEQPLNTSPRRHRPERFDIHRFVSIIDRESRSWEPPAITALADKGATPFEVLVSTLLSLRTRDPVTLAASEKLFARARTPQQILRLTVSDIEKCIYPVGFYKTKARRLHEISRLVIERYNGRVPDRIDELVTLPGVGRKTANLVLVEGFGLDAICVDTHVHRISNRTGYVNTRTPEQTEQALRRMLPRCYWIRYNELLVAFGQLICKPLSPLCSRCPVVQMCARRDVRRSR